MPPQANSSLAKVAVSGRIYPAVYERRCRVCTSGPLRTQIEEETVSGKSWATIAVDLPAEAGLNARNLRDHFANGHLPVEEPTVQALADRQAADRGQVVEQAVEVAVDFLDFCRGVIGSVNKRVLTGEVQPTVRDAIAAATVLARFDPGPTMTEDDYYRAFAAYHETVADVMAVERFADLNQRLEGQPVLKELKQKWDEIYG